VLERRRARRAPALRADADAAVAASIAGAAVMGATDAGESLVERGLVGVGGLVEEEEEAAPEVERRGGARGHGGLVAWQRDAVPRQMSPSSDVRMGFIELTLSLLRPELFWRTSY
jgi:hypothetical protein